MFVSEIQDSYIHNSPEFNPKSPLSSSKNVEFTIATVSMSGENRTAVKRFVKIGDTH